MLTENNVDEQIGLGGVFFPAVFFMTEEDVKSMTVSQLKGHLEEIDLPTDGKKKVLTTRLMEAVEAASFYSVEKTEWLGKANLFQGKEVWAEKVSTKLLGVSSPDAQLVKDRFVNLFVLKGMSKKQARVITMKLLRADLYPPRSWRRIATGPMVKLIRGRQQALRDYFYGITGTYMAHKKNLEYIGNLLEETKKEVKGLKYYPVEYFLDAEGVKKYKATKERLKKIVDGKVITGHTVDDIKKAQEDNEAFGNLLKKQARSLFNESRYYQLGQRTKRLRAHRKIAVRKEIQDSIYYESVQPWMFKAVDFKSVEGSLQSALCEEWLDQSFDASTTLPGAFFMLDARDVGEIFNVKSLYEFGAGESVLTLAGISLNEAEEEKKATIEWKSSVDDFLSSL